MLYRLLGFCLILLACAAPARAAGDDAPAWLRQAASQSAPAYDRKVPAVVLHKERSVNVSADGRVTTTTTYAVRVLTREGRGEAIAHDTYLTDSGKVREMRAWLIRPTGEVKRYGDKEVIDRAVDDDDIYNEQRVKLISAVDDADAGAVFGYQSVSEDRTVFTQTGWPFQDNLPTLVSRFALTLPAGWRASGVVFNHAQIEPIVSGSTYTWEMRGLPFVADEPGSPNMHALVPRLAVSYYPAEGASTQVKAFETWADVARWMHEIEEPQATVDDALAAKARQLTAGAKSEIEKIRAIARYVQGIQYISIQTNVGWGGGYRPHPATEVFAKSYGDCKDKANLMRTMLRVVGIEAYLVSIYAGDSTYVRAEWPSPNQFNHCIIAVKVGPDTQAQTVIEHPRLGRLLIFDATDENTPVGDLPEHEQGSLALIDAKESDALVRMPVMSPEANRLERETLVTLTADGHITATLRERSVGQSAVRRRSMFKQLSRPDYQKVIEGWITTNGATLARFSKVEPSDNHAEGHFSLDVEFSADRYAQTMMNRLLVFKPVIVSQTGVLPVGEKERQHPVVLRSRAYSEVVRFKLPEGFEVDEMPEGVKLDEDFGSYAASYEVKDGQLIFRRTLVQRAATIPAERYKAVREFFGRIQAVEQSPVVLAKK